MVKDGSLVFLDGELIAAGDAKISVFDRGFLYGDGVFETMRTYNGTVFRLEDHIDRLYQSAALIGLRIIWKKSWLKRTVIATATANNAAKEDMMLRLTVSRGVSEGFSIPNKLTPTIVIAPRRLPKLTVNEFNRGWRAIIASTKRIDADSLIPSTKSLNFLNNIMAKMEADNRGADEAIMLNSKGKVVEGTISNLFAVKGGKLRTPPINDGLLPGVTRKVVIELAAKNNIDFAEISIWPSDLYQADELFLTMTSAGIMPVTFIDGCIIGTGKAGKMTQHMRKLFFELINGE